MASQYLFFAGGSGARVAQAYAYLSAMGLMGSEHKVHITLCDADVDHGNVASAYQTLQQYKEIRSAIYPDGFEVKSGDLFSTEIAVDKWSLDSQGAVTNDPKFCLKDLMGGKEDAELARLIGQVLFEEDEQTKQFKDLGFFAHPNVGSAVVASAILRERDEAGRSGASSVYHKIKQNIQSDLVDQSKHVYIFLAGSLFGGTGAAAMPAIARDLEGETSEGIDAGRVHIGAAMLLPYFMIPNTENPDDQLVHNDAFLPGTKMALAYYAEQVPQLFHAVYPLGLPSLQKMPNEAVFGGQKQRNPSCLVEWVAAMAVRDFVKKDPPDPAKVSSKIYAACVEEDAQGSFVIDKDSFMSDNFYGALLKWMNFAMFYSLYLYPNILCGRLGKRVENWYIKYVSQNDRLPAIDTLNVFLQDSFAILGELLGMGVNDGNRPVNRLLDLRDLQEILQFVESMPPSKAPSYAWKKKAFQLMCQKGFRLLNIKNKTAVSGLIKAIATFSDKDKKGHFADLIKTVNERILV